MYSLALLSLSAIAVINAQTVTESRYFMDDDNDAGLTALPIDVCFCSNGAPPTRYTRYTCSADGTSVTKRKYLDAKCTDQDGTYSRYFGVKACGKYSFNCTASKDEYIEVGAYFRLIGNDDRCQDLQTTIPSVLGCFCNDRFTSYNSTCSSSTVGEIQIFDGNNGCSGTASSVEDLSRCTLVDDSIINVYSKIADCVKTDVDKKNVNKSEAMRRLRR